MGHLVNHNVPSPPTDADCPPPAPEPFTGVDNAALVNQDIHWYRFTEAQQVRLAVDLVDNLGDIQDNFTAAGLSATVSVCETGASVLQYSTDPTAGAAYPRYITSATDEDLELFQAREVVRRLATAAAAGASYCAWNSFEGIHTSSNEFYGTGLLEDAASESAATAHLRLSAFTYQKLRELWSDWRPFGGEVLHPTPSTGRYHDLMETDVANALAVLRFRVNPSRTPRTTPYRYLYVIYYDSAVAYFQTTSASLSVSVGATCQVLTIPVIPSARAEGGDGTHPDWLPQDDAATWDAPTEATWSPSDVLPALVLAPDDDPLVLLSTREISFR